MTNISEIEEGLSSLQPGAVIRVDGYVRSDGTTIDTAVYELLPACGFQEMRAESLSVLLKWKANEITLSQPLPQGHEEAVEALIESLSKKPAEGDDGRRGPRYETLGSGQLAVLDSSPDAVYLLRLKAVSGQPEPKEARGAIPRAKQLMSSMLGLPMNSYVHALKFEAGKFDYVSVVIA